MFKKYTRTELEKMGFVINPNMWIGHGFFYCANCKSYAYHDAMSGPTRDCVEVCKDCNCYMTTYPLD